MAIQPLTGCHTVQEDLEIEGANFTEEIEGANFTKVGPPRHIMCM